LIGGKAWGEETHLFMLVPLQLRNSQENSFEISTKLPVNRFVQRSKSRSMPCRILLVLSS
jgi:hypothetical protein